MRRAARGTAANTLLWVRAAIVDWAGGDRGRGCEGSGEGCRLFCIWHLTLQYIWRTAELKTARHSLTQPAIGTSATQHRRSATAGRRSVWCSSSNPNAVPTMSKRPTDHLEPSAKKRGNERQLTKDDEEDDEEQVRRLPLWALLACWHTCRSRFKGRRIRGLLSRGLLSRAAVPACHWPPPAARSCRRPLTFAARQSHLHSCCRRLPPRWWTPETLHGPARM